MKPVYLLDTCVVSEPVKPCPSEMLISRLKKHENLSAIPSVVWHELLYGTGRLPEGKKKSRLNAYIMEIIAQSFPVISYDEHSAWIHSAIRVRLEKKGRIMSFADSMIASIAVANNMILVTRNTDDFIEINELMTENWFLQQFT